MKKKLLIILICLAVVLGGIAAVVFIPENPIMDMITKTVRVGIIEENAPFSYFNEDGEASGFSCDAAMSVFNKAGHKVRFVKVTADNRDEMLKKGKIDCYMDFIGDTAADGTVISKSYLSVTQGTFYKADLQSAPDSAEELSNFVCAYVTGTAGGDFLSKYTQKTSPFINANDAAAAISQGNADVLITDSFRIEKLLQNEEYADYVSGISLFEQDSRIAFSTKKEKLKDEVNSAIEALKKDGAFKLLKTQYGLD